MAARVLKDESRLSHPDMDRARTIERSTALHTWKKVKTLIGWRLSGLYEGTVNVRGTNSASPPGDRRRNGHPGRF